MSELADLVLPLIRTRADLHRWSRSNEHGRQMHEAVDLLEEAAADVDPAEFYRVTHKAVASAMVVIARADDSSGIIGDACRRLLAIHPGAAARAVVSVAPLVDWMIAFQFEGEVDYFELDPVAYAPALGTQGVERYRARLEEIAGHLGPTPSGQDRCGDPGSHARFVLEWNSRRLAVLDRDVDAVIRTHVRDGAVAAWFEAAAVALVEINATDEAIVWAKKGMDLAAGPQSVKAGEYWCAPLATHDPDKLVPARVDMFDRWPSSTTAAQLYRDAGPAWPDYRDQVLDRLGSSPRDAVLFALLSLKDTQLAWDLADTLGLQAADVWERLATEYERIDPLAVLPILTELVQNELAHTGAQHYRLAARRLSKMRGLATGTAKAAEVQDLIARTREMHRNRPRLQLELNKQGLP